jgi:hypothetical protein
MPDDATRYACNLQEMVIATALYHAMKHIIFIIQGVIIHGVKQEG